MRDIFTFGGSFEYDGDMDITAEAQGTIMAALIHEYCTPEEIVAFTENYAETALAQSESILLERNIVKLDKKAKINRAYKAAIFQIAREKKDPKFKKLVTVWKMERHLEGYLEKKYGSEAKRRAKKTVTNAAKSKVGVANKAANRLKASLSSGKVKK